MSEVDDLLKRYDKAKAARQPYDRELDDAMMMACGLRPLDQTDDQATQKVFDSTLRLAARDSASVLHATITPVHTGFFSLGLADGAEKMLTNRLGGAAIKQIEAGLAENEEALNEAIQSSNFHLAVAEAYLHSRVAHGVLLCHEERYGQSPFRFEAVDPRGIYVELGPRCAVTAVFRPMRVRADELTVMWPDAAVPNEVTKLGRDEVAIVEATIYEHGVDRWQYRVVLESKRQVIVKRTLRRSPWLIFASRWTPHLPIGRGPVLDAVPDALTTNRAVELMLSHAEIAVAGMWQADDDGVLNVRDIVFGAGKVFPKAPGSAGLTPLQPAYRFDVSQLLLEDLRKRIRYAVFGPELPPIEAAGMTATEVERRTHEQNLVRGPELMRVWTELVVPLVQWGMDVLREQGVEIVDLDIGHEALVIASSPMARLQGIGEVVNAKTALAIAAEVAPQEVGFIAPAERFVRWALERAQYPQELMADEQEADAARAAAAQAAQAAQMVDAAPQLAGAAKDVGLTMESMQ